MTQDPLIFCALDTPDLDHACRLARTVGPVTGGIKLGLEFVHSFGPQGVEKVQNACPDAALFLDLKFHDIPNTVAGAVRSISKNFRPAFLNVHAAGGIEMMSAAKNACAPETKLLAVTILTSLEDGVLMIFDKDNKVSIDEQVMMLAQAARASELDGVVCSGHETAKLRRVFGDNFALMVPGIRPEGSDKNDQRRVMTPSQALDAGASHLVIGRPITGAKDPAAAAQAIMDGIKNG